jgi:glutaredoxin
LNVKLYALSTCGWCRKTKAFLDDNDIAYDLVYVDLLEKDKKDKVITEVRKWNPKVSFPTIVIDDQKSVSGFREDRLREVLGL